MKKAAIGLALIAILFTLGLFFVFNKQSTTPLPSRVPGLQTDRLMKNTVKAKFLIFTNGTRRDFSDSRYHNLSNDIYIDPQASYEIVSLKADSTWEDFFKTLPMKVDKDCLTTGTGQIFCSNETEGLKFYINGKLDPNALAKRIEDGDKLLISFGSEGEAEIGSQLKDLNGL